MSFQTERVGTEMTTKPPDREELERLLRPLEATKDMSPEDIRAKQEAKLKAALEDKKLERQRHHEQEMRWPRDNVE